MSLIARRNILPPIVSVVSRKDSQNLKPKPFDEIPGPKPLPLFGNKWRYLPVIGQYPLNHLNQAYAQMYAEYGPLVREYVDKNRTLVHVFDLYDMHVVCSNEGRMPERRSHTAVARYRKERSNIYPSPGLVPSNGEEWLKFRQLFTPVLVRQFSETTLGGLENVVEDLVKSIAKELDGNKETDVTPHLSKWALESIGVIALNRRLGFFTDEGHKEAMKLIDAANAIHEAVFWTENESFTYNKHYKNLVKAENYFERCVRKYMEEALVEIKRTNDKDSLLAKMLENSSTDKATIFTMLVDLFLGGIDTTANTITFVLYNLAVNPLVQEKFRAELMEQLPAKTTRVTEARYRLSYLLRVLDESLRVNPVAVGVGRIIPKDLVLSGYFVPAKTMVILQHQVASMQEKYVRDPKVFRPERWIGDERPPPLLCNPFGTGPRMCIGHRIAKTELRVVMARIFRNFKITYHHEPVKTYNRLVNVPLGPVRLRFHAIDN